MTNKSEEMLNSYLVALNVFECLKKPDFGLFFCYFITSLCVLVGISAHLWCLWVYLCCDLKINQIQVFFLNQTIMELISCTECVVELLNTFIFMDYNLFLINAFIFGLSWTGRPLIQCCICIEQYFAVIHPVTFLKYKGRKYRIAAVAVAWLMAFGYGLYEVYFLNFTDLIFNSVFIVSVIVISFCCVSVLCALKHPGPGDTQTTTQAGRDVRNQKKKNAFNMIFAVLLIFLLTYLPQTFLIFFTLIKIDFVLLYCNLAPMMCSLSMFSLIITPLMKMFKEGYLKKCLNHRNKENDGNL